MSDRHPLLRLTVNAHGHIIARRAIDLPGRARTWLPLGDCTLILGETGARIELPGGAVDYCGLAEIAIAGRWEIGRLRIEFEQLAAVWQLRSDNAAADAAQCSAAGEDSLAHQHRESSVAYDRCARELRALAADMTTPTPDERKPIR